jgi:hypothetical protein
MFTTKVIVTLPPPGIENVPHAGTAAPTVGLLVLGRLAPPASTGGEADANVNPPGKVSLMLSVRAVSRFAAFATTIVYVAVTPVGVLLTVGVLVVFVTVSEGTQSAPGDVPGMLAARSPVTTLPAAPAVAP